MVEKSVSKKLRRLAWSFGLLLIIITGLCIWKYPIPYVFFTQTISDLGAMYAYVYDGLTPILDVANPISRWIFSGGFIVLGIVAIWMAIIYFKHDDIYADKFKGILMILLAIGAVFTAYPWDAPLNIIHTIGFSLFVASFGIYNFVCQRLRYVRKHEIAKTASKGKKFDNFLDLMVAILVFLVTAWYLISGLLGAILPEKTGLIEILFPTGFAQKILLMVCIAASLLLDLDDV